MLSHTIKDRNSNNNNYGAPCFVLVSRIVSGAETEFAVGAAPV